MGGCLKRKRNQGNDEDKKRGVLTGDEVVVV